MMKNRIGYLNLALFLMLATGTLAQAQKGTNLISGSHGKIQVSKLAEIVGIARSDTAQAVGSLDGLGLTRPQAASIAAIISSPAFQQSTTTLTDLHISELKNSTTVASFIEALRSKVTGVGKIIQVPKVAPSIQLLELDPVTANQIVVNWTPRTQELSEVRYALLDDPTQSGELARLGLGKMLFHVSRVCKSGGTQECTEANATLNDMVLANCQTQCSAAMFPLIFEGIDTSGVLYSATATRRGVSFALRRASHRVGNVEPQALRNCLQTGSAD